MKNERKINKIIETISNINLKIMGTQVTNNNDYIITTEDILFLYETDIDRFNISFHISVRPDISAKIIKEIIEDLDKDIMNINIMEPYFFDKKLDMKYGNEAMNLYYDELKTMFIESFLHNQIQNNLLRNDHGFHA